MKEKCVSIDSIIAEGSLKERSELEKKFLRCACHHATELFNVLGLLKLLSAKERTYARDGGIDMAHEIIEWAENELYVRLSHEYHPDTQDSFKKMINEETT